MSLRYGKAAEAVAAIKNLPSDYTISELPVELAELETEQVKIWLFEKEADRRGGVDVRKRRRCCCDIVHFQRYHQT